MEINVNDKPMEVDARISVDQLLCTLGVKPTGTAVAVNDKIVKRDNWAEAEPAARRLGTDHISGLWRMIF